ncbi:hypothetical protein IP88_07855 [alpha proteobacterium AAP81b]|nr:hypothetical protein IP88_07855 [alpha proteobacterium AAP81b]
MITNILPPGVRRAHERDLALLAAIEDAAGEMFAGTSAAADMTLTTTPIDVHAAACARGSLWVAVDGDDAPLGFLLAEPVDTWLHILELDVHPDAQGRGLGAALIAAAGAAAGDFGCDRLSLTTFIDIPWNAPWYRRLGFAEIAAADQPDWLRGILRREAETGLDPANRCAMLWWL